jgi:chromosome segregation protein
MKLDFVEVSGFRGFRDKVRVDFGAGFTVITGRNGVGKSTLCDAIEFAVLGEISKYSVETSAKETVNDYIWWRGDGVPAAHYVTAAFSDDAGKQFIVTRSREAGADRTDEEIERALCQGAAPEDPLRQLCKTSIIRDEWIAALSLDLTETQRFELVRAALGSVEGADLATKAKSVVSAAETTAARVETAYEQTRVQLSSGLVQLSQATEVASRSADVTAAMTILDDFVVPEPTEPLAGRIDRARRLLPERRRRLDALNQAAFASRELADLRAEYDNPRAAARRSALENARAIASANLEQARGQLDIAERAFEVEARASEIAASLSALVEHGEKVGLDHGHCPLCEAARSDEEFSHGLARARERIHMLAKGINAARDSVTAARASVASADEAWSHAEQACAADAETLAVLQGKEQALGDSFAQFELPRDLIADPDALEREASAERNLLIEVERALIALEGSQAVSRLASIDSRVEQLRKFVDDSADELAKAQGALAAAKSLEKSVRRSASEIIDERLALISPLLNELYQRLRPHSDWRSIEYSIRGDIRRFLSLKVGNDLNPQFVFSSGQRRAAGLAFLLSVHLARSWSKWTTLILDDPVQHIDDFRALHLVEVLSAMRQGGRQVICAVEDEALADLLCRRLLSTNSEPGRRVAIDTDDKGSAAVVALLEIPPMPTGVLSGAAPTLAVG